MKSSLSNTNNNEKMALKSVERYNRNLLTRKYNTDSVDYNRLLISQIVYNEKSHLVSSFKEFLIFYEPGEFIRNYYNINESRYKIKTYCEFYKLNSRIFPNYVILPESKYVFHNIKKKQKMLDKQGENNLDSSNSYNVRVNLSDNLDKNFRYFYEDYSTIFTPSIISSIVNGSCRSTDKDEKEYNGINKIVDIINEKDKSNTGMMLEDISKINNITNKSNPTRGSGSFTEVSTNNQKKKEKNIKENKIKIKQEVEINIGNKTKGKRRNKISNDKKCIVRNDKNIDNDNEDFVQKVKGKFLDTEISNDYNLKKKNSNKPVFHCNIYKKTQSNGNIRNDLKIFKENETNKKSLLLNTNSELKSFQNNNCNKQNKNLKKYIQNITNVSNKMENNLNIFNDKKTSTKNCKTMMKKSATSKNNTTYSNKTQSQTSISYRHKKVSSITKSMPKLPTSYEKNRIYTSKANKNKEVFHNHLICINLKQNQKLINNGGICHFKRKKSNKNKKPSYKIKKQVNSKSNFYQILQNNINYNLSNLYNNNNKYNSSGGGNGGNNNYNNNYIYNNNPKNNIIPSLHLSLGNIVNNNTFFKCGSSSISKSKRKSNSKSKSKSINKSNSFIKILDNNQRGTNVSYKQGTDVKKSVNIVNKNIECLQTERTKPSFKPNKVGNYPKNTTLNDINLNLNINICKATTNINKNINTNISSSNNTNININSSSSNNKKTKFYINLKKNVKQPKIYGNNIENNKMIPNSARNKNNNNNISEPYLVNHPLKPTSHRIINRFSFNNGKVLHKSNNIKNKMIFNEENNKRKGIFPGQNFNIEYINNVNNNNLNNFFSQQNIKNSFNRTLTSRKKSISQTNNAMVHINNDIFSNKNNFNYIYNNSSHNKKSNSKIKMKNNPSIKNLKEKNKIFKYI